ncbi:MAG: beta-glucanase [Candidatus Marinimicrobia bacterium]|nr:beta-glucanase [Candidatus Neomarinimicrobiota bacterium]|tara:strand:- start:1251 stop:2756 length:1506 start_codon:yes stop_codon:yes gene_type:complete
MCGMMDRFAQGISVRLVFFILSFFTYTKAVQVTFIVDMSEEIVVAGDGNYPAVYVSGSNFNGPSGIEMTDNGDGTWKLTTELESGDYTYKFRNGYYDYWDSPGWEGDNGLIEDGCAVGEYFDRLVSVDNSDLVEGIFCFGSCDDICVGELVEYLLIWNDEFDVNGAIDSSKWFHQIQLPNGYSWYNNEIQHYTNRLDNSYVSDGTLKIVAKKETYTNQGETKEYTSARLNSKYAITYGKVEIRARLPQGIGTWPAIWMLGQNINEPGAYWQTQGYATTSWPSCGEIDIMEHWGANQNYVQSALHTPSSHGGTINHGGQYISNSTSQFNIYALEWTPEHMIFSVNEHVHYTYSPETQNSETWPFDSPQYLLINIAIEQSIEPSFVETEMEIDYVRFYKVSSLLNQIETEPKAFILNQNFPNPFNPSTNISFLIPRGDYVSINIFDVNGVKVTEIFNNYKPAGTYSIDWNGQNDKGVQVSSGVYLYSIEAGNFRQTKKMILLK